VLGLRKCGVGLCSQLHPRTAKVRSQVIYRGNDRDGFGFVSGGVRWTSSSAPSLSLSRNTHTTLPVQRSEGADASPMRTLFVHASC
jgi:hypothetical protein